MLPKFLTVLCSAFFLTSCWKLSNRPIDPYPATRTKVLGYKPLYGAEPAAKQISYMPSARPVVNGGNIYAFNNYIFQVEAGAGIHVIDNTVPSAARRIGFITVKGCSQLSIKAGKLYTNSYDDLVVVDMADLNNVHEFSRLRGVFTEFRYGSPLAQPPASGYYECPKNDSLVIGWVKDSVYQSCFKN